MGAAELASGTAGVRQGAPVEGRRLGVGLIGGSIGLAARARARARRCAATTPTTQAARTCARARCDRRRRRADIAGAVAGADVVFVAAPVGALAETRARGA